MRRAIVVASVVLLACGAGRVAPPVTSAPNAEPSSPSEPTAGAATVATEPGANASETPPSAGWPECGVCATTLAPIPMEACGPKVRARQERGAPRSFRGCRGAPGYVATAVVQCCGADDSKDPTSAECKVYVEITSDGATTPIVRAHVATATSIFNKTTHRYETVHTRVEALAVAKDADAIAITVEQSTASGGKTDLYVFAFDGVGLMPLLERATGSRGEGHDFTEKVEVDRGAHASGVAELVFTRTPLAKDAKPVIERLRFDGERYVAVEAPR